jgi:hypothetical protein
MEKIINSLVNFKMALILFFCIKIFKIEIIIDEYGNIKKFNLIKKCSKKIKYYCLDFWINDSENMDYEHLNNKNNLILFNYPVDINELKKIVYQQRHIYINKNKKIKLKF